MIEGKMANGTTHMSSKGQVVIPAWARRRLQLIPGQRFEVEVPSGRDRTLVLRAGSGDEFTKQIAVGSEWLARRGLSMVEALRKDRRVEREREARRRSRR